VILISGNKVVYPSLGPCLVGPRVQKVVNNRPLMFRELLLLSNGGRVFIPIANLPSIGVRPLLSRLEVKKVLDRLKESTTFAVNWKERATENLNRFKSGSALALAEIIGSLTELSKTRTLTTTDSKALEKARMLLVCEISEVMGQTRSAIEEELDHALEAIRTPSFSTSSGHAA
jgi:CarD family transcriptional regulator